MPTLTAEYLIELLTRYVTDTGESVDLLLVGALALHAYGIPDRATRDVDAELEGPLTGLMDYLTAQWIPADLTQNFSGWSVVAMPPGYRDRAQNLVDRPSLRVRVLSPVDFVIAKLRRGTELDLDDALLVARRHGLPVEAIRTSARAAIAASSQDTVLFLFQKTVDLFCEILTRPNG
ncbi:MAG: DUF6036 family nucleotidyltransferase [Nitrospiraceae bacterium]